MLELQEQYRDLPISRIDAVYSGATDTFERYYKVGDYDAMPSVTTILEMISKPALRDWKMNKALDFLKSKYEGRHWDDRIATPPWVRFPSSPKAQSLRKKVKTSWRDALASLRRNAKHHPNQVRDNAGGIGTEVHEAIAAEMRGESWELTSEPAAIAMQSFRLWQEDATIEPLWTEQTVWSLEYGYAGSADLVGMEGSKLIVLDWKTGAGVHNDAGLQIAAYSHAIEEMTGATIDECKVIHLDKSSPGWSEHTVKDWRRSFNGFLSALNTWKLWHDGVFDTSDNS